MALRANDVERGALYLRYLQALNRYGPPEDPAPSPGHAIRQCTHCGRATIFRLDPEGTWFECSRCGHFA
jgi:hypothetical protein